MSENTELMKVTGGEVMAPEPVMPMQFSTAVIQAMKTRIEMVKQVMRTIMRKGRDYGVVPGTSGRPSLLKPGAEKLCAVFGLRAEFVPVETTADFDRGFFNYAYRCKLYHGATPMGECIGSCNSMEKKYRYRAIPFKKASDEDKARAVEIQTRKGDYGDYQVCIVENTEIFDIVNTIQKMAQKRALVGAVRIVTGVSDVFEDGENDADQIPERDAQAPSQSRNARQPRQAAPAQEPPIDVEAAPARPENCLTIKFLQRTSPENVKRMQDAGFTFDTKKNEWFAERTTERLALFDELEREGLI